MRFWCSPRPNWAAAPGGWPTDGRGLMELSHATRVNVRQALGPSAETVFDVIAHHYTGTGVELAHRQMATEANVSEKTVRRIIDKRVDAGWLTRDHQFR